MYFALRIYCKVRMKEWKRTDVIRRVGEEKKGATGKKRHKPRRGVVERTVSWLSRCRSILIRWDKKAEDYVGIIQLACALLWYRRKCRLET